VGGTPDLLQYGAFGRLAPEGKAVAEAILETLRDPTAARYRARAGQAHVPREHSAARLLSDVDRLYRELLAGKSAA
jgi:glycosyltransferase involved in cell wall biosynthesis